MTKPNVLLITADQWRGDCLSLAGHPLVETPHLDALAAEGVSFLKHHSTTAPCSPARASLYTGLYQMNHRVCINGTPLDRRHDTLGLAFRRLGYEPTLFGYMDQSGDPRGRHPADPALRSYEGVLPGFEVRLLVPEHQRPYRSWLASRGYADALGARDVHVPTGGVDDPPSGAAPTYRAEHTDTAFVVEEFLRWQDEQCHARSSDPDHAWFAHVSFLRPHPPFVVPAPYNTRYAPEDVPPLRGGAGQTSTGASGEHPFAAWSRSRLRKGQFVAGAEGFVRDWDEDAVRRLAATYYGMLAEVDDQLGRLVDTMKRVGTWDDTLVVFTSDHGEMLGEHGLLGKGGFHDASYHIPLIVRDPAAVATRGTRVERFTESVDVLPTLLDRLGATPPPQLDGASLSPFLERADAAPDGWRTAAFWEFDFRDVEHRHAEAFFGLDSRRCNLAVHRSDTLKYVHFAGLPPLLFDLVADPEQRVNLADDPARVDERLACAEALLAHRAAHLDQSLALTKLTPSGPVGPRPSGRPGETDDRSPVAASD